MLDLEVLKAAVTTISARTEALCSRIVMVGSTPMQDVTCEPAEPIVVDVRGEPDAVAAANRWMREDLARPLNLTADPLVRQVLFPVADDRCLLYLRYHHLTLDGFGQMLYWRRVADAYTASVEGRDPTATPHVVPLVDLLAEDDDYRSSEQFARDREYWAGALVRPAGRLTDSKSREVGAVDIVRREPEPAIDMRRLNLAAASYRTHWSAIVLAALAAYLRRFSGQDELVIGFPVRARTSRAALTTPAMLSNELPLRLTVTPDLCVQELVGQVVAQVRDLLAHQRFRGEDVGREARRQTGATASVGVVANLIGFDAETAFGPARASVRQLSSGPVHGLAIDVYGGSIDAELGLGLSADIGLHPVGEIVAHQERLRAFLDVFVDAEPDTPVGDLEVLTPTERDHLVRGLNDTARPYDLSVPLHQLLRDQARTTPDAVALESGAERLTYAELDKRSDRLAAVLVAHGVRPGDVVAVHDVRSPELVASLLAVLKAGGAYLPLDPDLPRARTDFLIQDAGVRVILSRSSLTAQVEGPGIEILAVDAMLPGLPHATGPDVPVSPESPVYVIYTSGSTGTPKGVVVPHRGVVNRLLWMQEQYPIGPDDRVLQKTAYTFDVSVWEFFWPLITGATMVLAEPGMHRDPRYLARVMQNSRITVAHFVPSMLDLFLQEAPSGSGEFLRHIFCSGEALLPATVGAFFDRYPPDRAPVALHNLYGPTEASVDVTAWECSPADRGSVPIGRPVANTQAYVLDTRGRPAPIGVPGELALGGVQIASGYLNRTELTRDRFVPDPFTGGTLYRTGDIARWTADGVLEYLGRNDDQLKIRGFRVEPGEVESALLAHPAVAQAAVVASQDTGHAQLLAYVVPAGDETEADLLTYLRERLPAYLVPARIVALPDLPRRTSGKVDRNALPDTGHVPADTGGSTTHVPPSTPEERALAEVWQDILRVSEIGIDDSFFALGGDSMLAIRVRSALEQRHGLSFTVAQLLGDLTVRQLATALTRADGRTSSPTSPFELVSEADRELLPDGLDDAYPLTAMQAGMLYHEDYDGDSSVYRVVTSLRVDLRLDERLLREACDATAARHPSLRCSVDLSHYSEPLQLVHHEVEVPVEVGDDLDGLDAAGQRARIEDWVARAKVSRFDLAAPPLLRFTANRLADHAFQLSVVEHHVVLDGWSDLLLLEEVLDRYRAALAGEEFAPAEVASTYRDFVAAERAVREDRAAREFWAARLAGAQTTPLPGRRSPIGHGGPARGTVNRRYEVPLPAGLAPRLRLLAEREGLPVKALLVAAHVLVLHSIGSGEEVLTGLVANARLEEPGGDEVIGVFLNTLPMRFTVDDTSVVDLARSVFEAERRAGPHRRYPFAQMLRDVGRDLELDSYVNYMDFDRTRYRTGAGLFSEALGVADTNYTLAVNFLVEPGAADLVLWLDCDVATLTEEFCERLGGYYRRALETVADAPHNPASQADLLGREELELLQAWTSTATAYDTRATVPSLISAQVARTPDAVALAHRWEGLSYADLDAHSNRLAHHLLEAGVRPGELVGVSVRRGIPLVVALLGVMKAGAAYVPMDPLFPLSRLETIAEDAGIRCLVTAPGTPSGLAAPQVVDLARDAGRIAAQPSTPPDVLVAAGDTAYVMYTSGSTGKPKGTSITHRNLVNFCVAMDERIGCGPDDVLLAVTSVSFDISVLELLWPLMHGAKVVVAAERIIENLAPSENASDRSVGFSLFFFAARSGGGPEDYRLVLDAAKFADRHGFEAIWTPERHFHDFGGLYPNPSVMSAALATVTERLGLRCGSVVAPLHDPVRMAEEWSLVDNLSGGRVGMAFAPGWNSNDFVFFPERYGDRKQVMAGQLEEFRRLWRGEPVQRVGGSGEQVDVRIFPKPVQHEPPFWITTTGSVDTFKQAGAAGLNVLTHLLGQDPAALTAKIAAYRQARAEHGHAGAGQVTLMVHTYLAEDVELARRTAREPFRAYLHRSTELWRTLFATTGQEFPQERVEEQLDAVIDLAIDRYFETSGLFGSPESCAELVRMLAVAGVDEIACLIDFGIATDDALAGLAQVDRLRSAHEDELADSAHSLAELCRRHGVTMMQGTPSLMISVAAEPAATEALQGARALLIGGEAFPSGLARRLLAGLPHVRLFNMYGPTETTIWSTVHELDADHDTTVDVISIGRPIANTSVRVVDRHDRLVPVEVPGELWIGGDGVAAGYLGRPELTAERFVRAADTGERYYRTGDRVRWRIDGALDFLGRIDRQVKIRGHRVEPDEVESVLSRHPELDAVAVTVRAGASGPELVAYVSPTEGHADLGIQEEHVRRWADIWQEAYADTGQDGSEPAGRFAGWLSSYTGKPIPAEEMREWLGHTVQRIRQLRPRRLLDIGVGVGLVLGELAEETDGYVGIDVSTAALQAARTALGAGRPLPAHVRLVEGDAESLADFEPATVDTVVLNSVVQYFPGVPYLHRVLTDAVRATAPGGAVFVGDVRSLESLPQFHTTVQLSRAMVLQTLEEVRTAVQRQVREERELCLSPSVFVDLARELDGVTGVRVEAKRGRADNEMSQFRYDVTLLVGEHDAEPVPQSRIAWSQVDGGLSGLERRLAEEPGALAVTRVPNRRSVRPAAAEAAVAAGDPDAIVWDLEAQLWEVDESTAVHPEELYELAARVRREVRVTVPADGYLDHLDVLFAEHTTAGRENA